MDKCLFCGEKLIGQTAHSGDWAFLAKNDCPVCGEYYYSLDINQTDVGFIPEEGNLTAWLVNCVAENIKINDQGRVPFWHKNEMSSDKKEQFLKTLNSSAAFNKIDDYKNVSVRHSGKLYELLKLFGSKLKNKNPFEKFKLDKKDLYKLKIATYEEATEWLKILYNAELISGESFEILKNRRLSGLYVPTGYEYNVTPEGWQKIDEITKNINSRMVFIAMSFGYKERAQLQEAIEIACKEAGGWNAITVDKTEFLGGISDEIIGMINQSAFVIAEFTENKHGVYYEAGYAHGRNIPVIYIIKNDDNEKKKLHFDTKHLNHITWDNYDDLKTKLVNKINAVINK